MCKNTNLSESLGRRQSYQTRKVSGLTYVFKVESCGLYKIGWAGNEEWVLTATRENPELRIVMMAEGNIIADIYRKYSDKKVRSDWFILNDGDIEEMKRLYFSHDDAHETRRMVLLYSQHVVDHERRITDMEQRLTRLETMLAFI